MRRQENSTKNSRISASRKGNKVNRLHRMSRASLTLAADEHVSACGVVLAQLESLYHSLVTSLTSVFVEQIDKLVQSEEKVNISDAKERLVSSRRQVDVALRKLLEHKAEKTDNDPKTQKALEDGLKTLDEQLAEGARRADLWDKAARQEIYAALAACMQAAISLLRLLTSVSCYVAHQLFRYAPGVQQCPKVDGMHARLGLASRGRSQGIHRCARRFLDR